MGDIYRPRVITVSKVVQGDADVQGSLLVPAKGESGHDTTTAHYQRNVNVQQDTVIVTNGVADGNTTGVRIDGNFKATGNVIVGTNGDRSEIQDWMTLLRPNETLLPPKETLLPQNNLTPEEQRAVLYRTMRMMSESDDGSDVRYNLC